MKTFVRSLQRAAPLTGLLLFALLPAPSLLAATLTVEIVDYRFMPAELRIRAGDSVRWINREKRTSHSILFPATGQESERLFPDEHWEKLFERAGLYRYRCGPHPEMEGVVHVE